MFVIYIMEILFISHPSICAPNSSTDINFTIRLSSYNVHPISAFTGLLWYMYIEISLRV